MPYQPYRSPDPFTTLRGNLRRAGIPVTIGIIFAVVVLFLIDTFGNGVIGSHLDVILARHSIINPWGVISFPFVGNNIVTVLLGGYWLWSIGGSLERSWGIERYSQYLIGSTLLTALCIWIGCAILNDAFALASLGIPLALLTVSWASLNPNAPCSFLIFPMKAWVVAAVIVLLLYFLGFEGHLVLGLFGLLPCVAAWWYVAGGFSSGYAFRGYAKRGPDLRMTSTTGKSLDGSRRAFSISGWLKERKEKQKLKELWRNSGLEDKDLRR